MLVRNVVLLMAFAWCAFAQTTTGVTQTVVTDDSGQPVSGAYIVATPLGSAGGLTITMLADAKGAFSLSALKPGAYSVCVQEPGGLHLDPCKWSTVPKLTVTAASAAALALPPIVKGSVFQLRINDPGKVWAQTDDLLVGITVPTSMFQPLRLAASDSTGKTFDVAVPFDTALAVYVSSSHLLFADATGKSLGHTVSIPFKQAAAAVNPALTLTITGRN